MRGILLIRRPVIAKCPSCIHLTAPILRLRCQLSTATTAEGPPQLSIGKGNERKGGGRSFKAPETPCRTRFAPSPTGYLHLGSLRTALFNYLLARRTEGQFVLRIEDTDQARTVPDAEKRLLEDLRWAGLSWDEGPDVPGPYGPYRQSERLSLYNEHAQKLLDQRKAYRCFCSQEDLAEQSRLRHEQGQPTHYPGTCRSVSPDESEERASKGESFVVRFRSSQTPTNIHDIVYGKFRKAQPEDDYVIIKSDGFPTYHFANVVDDKHMEITHVIRGAEWLISTPKHVELYNAFGWQPPQFGHVGLLVDEKRHKLSKRHAGVDITWYKDQKILPAALLNFSVLLGWSRDSSLRSDVLQMQEMIDNFSLKFTKGDIMVNFKKLHFLQDQHLRRLWEEASPESAVIQKEYFLDPIDAATRRVIDSQSDSSPVPREKIGEAVAQIQQPDQATRQSYIKTILSDVRFTGVGQEEDFLSKYEYFFWAVPKAVLAEEFAKHGFEQIEFLADKAARVSDVLQRVRERLGEISEEAWSSVLSDDVLHAVVAKELEHRVRSDAEGSTQAGWKILRWALLGSGPGSTIWKTATALGREEILRRLDSAVVVANEIVASQEKGEAGIVELEAVV